MPKDPNDVGALWRRENARGDWFSVSVDLDQLLVCTGGATGKVSLVAFGNKKTSDKQPDFRLLFPTRREQPTAAQPAFEDDRRPRLVNKGDDDDEIPF